MKKYDQSDRKKIIYRNHESGSLVYIDKKGYIVKKVDSYDELKNIIHFSDLGLTVPIRKFKFEGKKALVQMEKWTTIADVLERKISCKKYKQILRGIKMLLKKMVNNNIICTDIKPQNAVLKKVGKKIKIRLIDFGGDYCYPCPNSITDRNKKALVNACFYQFATIAKHSYMVNCKLNLDVDKRATDLLSGITPKGKTQRKCLKVLAEQINYLYTYYSPGSNKKTNKKIIALIKDL